MGTALGLLLMIAIAAGVVFMGMLWPAFRYHHTASAASARWDVHVNGPLTGEDVDELMKVSRSVSPGPVRVANRGAIRRLWAASGSLSRPGDLYALSPQVAGVGASRQDHELAWTPEPLVVSGSMSGRGAAGIDWVTARRLRVSVGDTVRYSQVYALPSGRLRAHAGSARISAILATTSDLRGLVIEAPATLQATLERTVGIVGTDAFFSTGDPSALAARFESLPGAENWTIATRADYRRYANARSEQAGARAYGSVGLAVASALLFVAMMRESSARMSRRRSGLAVLYSLGAEPSGLVGIHLAEQLTIVALVSWLGHALGVELLAVQVGLYPPDESRALLQLLWLAASVVLLVLCVASVWGRLSDRALVRSAAEWRG